MERDMTVGTPWKIILNFTIPIVIGNIFQQFYSMVDTVIVGKFVGTKALAAVGSTGTIGFLILGFLMGLTAGFTVLTSQRFGAGDMPGMRKTVGSAAVLSVIVSVVMTVISMAFMKPLLILMNTPEDIFQDAYKYIMIICAGIFTQVMYNLLAGILRALGNSKTPLYFLLFSAALNIVLDLALVYGIRMGIKGAAIATVISQIVSGIGICIYTWMKMPELRFSLRPERIKESQSVMGEVVRYSAASSIQQSVMNFGILMIQGLVNSFGTAVMAAFAAAVKIDSFAYMPAQEFANAFSIFISQNRGAGKKKRVQKGVRSAVTVSAAFCICASVLIYFGARYLMLAFIDGSEHEIIRVGIQYLHIEGAFYCGIGILFLWYGYYRAVGRPEMSVVLTVISLGTRVLLSYTLAPIKSIGVIAIWWSIPIGWFLADVTGYVYLQYMNKKAKMCRN